jgi:hypothetical protein
MSLPPLETYPVYWIGGSFSGGKSTTARLLAERHDLKTYHLDWHMLNDPAFEEFLIKDGPWFWMSNELKMERYAPAFPTVVSQIEELSQARAVVVEGPGLLPHLLAAHHVDPEYVIYLLPTASFQRRVNRQRGEWVKLILAPFADPGQAWEEWMLLDEQFADLIEAAAIEARYRCVRNDGGLGVEDVVQLVAAHFGLEDGMA